MRPHEEQQVTERRKFPRIAVGLPAVLAAANGTEVLKVRAIDLGLDGLSVRSPNAMRAGTRCRVALSVPGNRFHTIETNCSVVYAVLTGCEYRLGLEFVELGSEARAHVRAYLDEREVVGY